VTSVEVLVPAKINLWLEVVGKRPDGYHELSTLMLPIALYDHLEVTLGGQDEVLLECTHPDVPHDERNLVWCAADRFRRAAGMAHGVRIRLQKNIPVGAGLGGGSADAGVLLALLNELTGRALDSVALIDLARGLGADVAFFLYRRPALATGIGERLEWVDGLPAYPIVLIKPPVMVPTRGIYQRLTLTRQSTLIKIHAFKAQPWDVRRVLENDLESVTIGDFPVILEIKQWLLRNGALGALMSGSGPTVFGIFRTEEQAQGVAERAREVWSESWVQAAKVLSSYDGASLHN
jgi:4-diphosphocytidyl-2-C-methyl-D-erythritol kinase